MPPVQGPRENSFHPTARRKVVAAADVSIRQVQVVDKNGQVRSIIVYQCGPDVMYAATLDGMFDVERRKKAPKWLLEQLNGLPNDRCFNANGTPKAGGTATPEKVEVFAGSLGIDDDLDGFSQA